MGFEYPFAFLLLGIYLVCEKFCPMKSIAIYFPHFEYTNKVNKNKILKFLIFFFAILALSSPYSSKEIIQTNKGDAIILSIDSSGSMDNFNKFEVVKKVASDFIDKRKDDKLGLVVFASNAFIASPLTQNKEFIKDVLSKMYVGIAGRNTAILDSLLQSVRLLKDSKAKTKIIILITDGIDNSSKISLEDVEREIKKYNIKVYSIGIGSANEVNFDLLEYISTPKRTFQATSIKDIQKIYDYINKLETTNLQHKIIYKEYYYYYSLILALILMLIYGRKRW